MKYLKIVFFAGVMLFASCTKFLDAVPNKSSTIPTQLADYQQLLENELMFHNMPEMGEFGTDDIQLSASFWESQLVNFKNAYIYAKDVNEGAPLTDWNNSYKKIYFANVVLEGLEKLQITDANIKEKESLRGWALFCRANAHYDLEEVFGHPYKPGAAVNDLGIPLKLSSNLTEKLTRATVENTFNQILKDLNEAAALLPSNFSLVNRSRPGKAAAYALLARVYQTMQNYDMALEKANLSLGLYSVLVDYNTLNAAAKLPFSPLNNEVIYNSTQIDYSTLYWQIDNSLYNSYSSNDLRKTVCFTENATDKTAVFKGFYTATYNAFNGLATDEVYFIRAECYARQGKTDLGLADLNTVLVKRYKTNTYVPYTLAGVSDALALILRERRKELIFRNLRWTDLRRLNQDPRFAKTVTHMLNGVSYQLLPNDIKYALPLPELEVRENNLEQNER